MKHSLPALAALLMTVVCPSASSAQPAAHERTAPPAGADHAPGDDHAAPGHIMPASDDTDDVSVKLKLAQTYRKQGHTDKAEQLYLQILNGKAGRARAHNGLGFIYEGNGEYPRAIESYRKALEIRPGWARPLFHIGSCLMEQKEYNEAEKLLCEAAKADPADASPRNRLGILYAQTGRLEAAEREYLAAAAIRPEWTAPYWNLVLLYDAQGKYRTSDTYLDLILELDPGNFDALYQRTRHLVGAVDYAMAQRFANKLVKLYPSRAAAHEALGIVQWSRENLPAAEASFRRALAIDAGYAGGYLGLGHVRLRQKRYDEAKENYRRALAIDSELLDAQRGLQMAGNKSQHEKRVGGGCIMAPSFACASPLGMLNYLLVIVPALLLRRRL
ncbi:MAG: tetratricopeptide repeat protein [Planctomycetes bacterium]|nr:tetratricopeptide repeat protein [Planctomycetota bacterium]